VLGVLDTAVCDTVCQWLTDGARCTWYRCVWYWIVSSTPSTVCKSLTNSITHSCIKYTWHPLQVIDKQYHNLIQLCVILFVNDLQTVLGVLDTAVCDTVCQWLTDGARCTWYNCVWYCLSMTCRRCYVYLIQLCCVTGIQTRTRSCNNGFLTVQCDGSSTESRDCNEKDCSREC
jgi:hypothetical protein